MSSITSPGPSLSVFTPERDSDRIAREMRERSEQGMLQGQSPSVFSREALGAAWDNTLLKSIQRHIELGFYDTDPNFPGVFADPERRRIYTQGIRETMHDGFIGVKSDAEAMAVREQLLEMQKSREILESMGYRGVAVQIAADIFDPSQLLLGVATGGLAYVGAAGRVAMNAGRASRFVRFGAANAAAAAAADGYIQWRDPEGSWTNVLVSTTGSFLLGGAIGAAIGPASAKRLVDDIETESMIRSAIRARAGGGGDSPDIDFDLARQALDRMDRRWSQRYYTAASEGDARMLDGIDPDAVRPIADDMAAAVGPTGDPSDIGVSLLLGEMPGSSPKLLPMMPRVEPTVQPEARIDVPDSPFRASEAGVTMPDDPTINPVALADATAEGFDVAQLFLETLLRSNENRAVTLAVRGGRGGEPPRLFTASMEGPDNRIVVRESGGAGGEPPTDDFPPKRLGDFDPPRADTDYEAAFPGFRKASDTSPFDIRRAATADVAGSMGFSKSRTLRVMGRYFVRDPLLGRNPTTGAKAPTIRSGSEFRQQFLSATMLRFSRGYNKALSQWFKSQGKNAFVGRNIHLDQVRTFSRQVIDHILDGTSGSPAVRDAARQASMAFREALELMKRHRVPGSLAVEHSDNYFPFMISSVRVRQKIAELSRAGFENPQQELERYMTYIIGKARPDLEPEVLEAFGRGYMQIIMSADYQPAQVFHAVAAGDVGFLAQSMRSAGIPEDQINLVLNRIKNREASSAPSRLKPREIYDHKEKYTVSGQNGSVELSFRDFIEDDVSAVVRTYASDAAGLSAERTVFDRAEVFLMGSSETGVGPKIRTIDDLKSVITEEHRLLGSDAQSVERDMMLLDIAWRDMRGLHQTAYGNLPYNHPASLALRSLRAVNNAIRSGSFALSSVVEASFAVSEAGFASAFRSIPAIVDSVRMARNGEFDSTAINQMIQFGLGSSSPRSQAITSRLPDLDAPSGQGFAGMETRVNQLAHANLYPLYVMDTGLRDGAVLMAIQSLADRIGTRKISAKRMLEYGLDESMAQRVADMLNDPNVLVKDKIGRITARSINFDAAKDQAAAQAFLDALAIMVERQIQTNNVGGLTAIMNHEIAKTILQYRFFNIQAFYLKTLRGIQNYDEAATYSAMALSTLGGAMVYMGLTMATAAGMEESEKRAFLEERLTIEKIATAGVYRSGMYSHIPWAIDQTASITGISDRGFFGHGRTTGLDPTGLFQNPTFALFESAARGVQGIGETAFRTNDVFAQSDARALANLLPFRNMVGIRQAIDWSISHLPEREQPR